MSKRDKPRAKYQGGSFHDLILAYGKDRAKIDPEYRRDVETKMTAKRLAQQDRQEKHGE